MSCIGEPKYSLGLAKRLIKEARVAEDYSNLMQRDDIEYDKFNKVIGERFRDDIEERLASCLIRCYRRNYLGTKVISANNKEIFIDCYKIETEDENKNNLTVLYGFKETSIGYYVKFIRIYNEDDALAKCLTNRE